MYRKDIIFAYKRIKAVPYGDFCSKMVQPSPLQHRIQDRNRGGDHCLCRDTQRVDDKTILCIGRHETAAIQIFTPYLVGLAGIYEPVYTA